MRNNDDVRVQATLTKHEAKLMAFEIVLFLVITSACCVIVGAEPRNLKVPRDFATIQAAIDEAQSEDTVIVSPGVYHEAIRIEGKSITLTSMDPDRPAATILDGSVLPDPTPDDDLPSRLDSVIYVGPRADSTTIQGFTIRDGDDGITCYSRINILNNLFVNNEDGIDYEGGGGLCRDNVFVSNDDDGVDLDEACMVTVERNRIEYNDDDGIEIRLHEYSGSLCISSFATIRFGETGKTAFRLSTTPTSHRVRSGSKAI